MRYKNKNSINLIKYIDLVFNLSLTLWLLLAIQNIFMVKKIEEQGLRFSFMEPIHMYQMWNQLINKENLFRKVIWNVDRSLSLVKEMDSMELYLLNTWHKVSVRNTFIRGPGSHINILCALSLAYVFAGYLSVTLNSCTNLKATCCWRE